MSFVQLKSFDNYITANLEMNLLKEAGIDCFLQDEHTITIDPLLSPAIGGMKLMIAEDQVEQAHHVLNASETLYLQEVICPVCGKTGFEKITTVQSPSGFWQQLASQIINGQVATIQKEYRCLHCKERFPSIPQPQT